MTDMALTVLDTTGIQEYIFGSNRLRENVVASHLVERATSDWVYEVLPGPNNLDEHFRVIPDWRLEDDALRRAELVYRGGGNVVLLFRATDSQSALDLAMATVGKLSRLLLQYAPGLNLSVAHIPFDWSQEALGGMHGVYDQAMQQLAHNKQRQRSSLGLPGQSVTLVCRSTGLPAVKRDPEDPLRPVSAAVAAKVDRDRRDEADTRLWALLQDSVQDDPTLTSDIRTYELSRELDDLGRSHGDMSYIAVVHADANRMAERFQSLVHACAKPQDDHETLSERNRRCVDSLRALSASLNRAGAEALKTTVRLMMDALRQEHFRPLCESLPRIPVKDRKSPDYGKRKPALPFRPLVFGGDDVTFVCDGRLGLTLAATYLEQFAAQAKELSDGKPAHACAGVAIVKTHYPFARAYMLCDELCRSAKRRVRETSSLPDGDGAALDWYFATTGITADLEALRERYYKVPAGCLDMRPVLMKGPGWRSWENFDRTVQTLLYAEQWRDRRNKVIALREALREGRQATEHFRVMYGVRKLPALDHITDARYRETGWVSAANASELPPAAETPAAEMPFERCTYFDAVEALDCYLPLTLLPISNVEAGT